MVALASRARVLSSIAAAGATLVAALALTPAEPGAPPASCPAMPSERADDGMRVTARWTAAAVGEGEYVVVEIAAPGEAPPVRPPLSVAIAIDRSTSMTGAPLAHAKAAAARLVAQLDAGDAFSIVAYSDGEATLAPMQRATAVHKEQALGAIAALSADGGTCISCGLERAGAWIARTPVEGGVRRVVLISDGYPTRGERDPDELVKLAADTAARGASVTAIGVGLAFDEHTMMRIARVGRGNYHYVPESGELGAAFDREVDGLSRTVAADARLTVWARPGVRIHSALGHELTAAGDAYTLPIADLAAGETRRVVLRVSGAPGPCAFAAGLSWRRPIDGAGRRATAIVRAEPDPSGALERALAGAMIERAAAGPGGAEVARSMADYAARIEAAPGLSPDVRDDLLIQLVEARSVFEAAAAGSMDAAQAVKQARELAHVMMR